MLTILPLVAPFLTPNPTYFHLSTLSKTYHQTTPLLPLPPTTILHSIKTNNNLDQTLHNLRLLNTGTFSTVRLLQHPLFQNIQLALKLLPKRLQIKLQNVQQLRKEVTILKALSNKTTTTSSGNDTSTHFLHLHPYISHISTIHTPAHLAVVTNLARGGELFTHVHHKHHRTRGPTVEEATQGHSNALSSCPPEATKFYIAQLVLALEHLHTYSPHVAILHRDLRQENILVTENSYLKLCDFGNARWLKKNARAKTLCGAPESTAPEMFVPNAKTGATNHGTGVDWWALGVLSYELNVGWSPFYSENPMDIYGRILASATTLQYPDVAAIESKTEQKTDVQEEWNRAKDCTLNLLHRDETKRLGGRDGKTYGRDNIATYNHPWFEDMNWETLTNQTMVPPRGAFHPSHELARNFELHGWTEEDPPGPLKGAKHKMIWNRWGASI